MDPQQDPHPDRPDYAIPQFEGLINLIIRNSEMTRDEAIAVLNKQWELQHPVNRQQQQQNQGGAEDRGAPNADPNADNGKNPFTFDPDLTVSSSLQCRPLDYVLKQLETFKYVPLWYFTREGLAEAATVIRIADEKTEPLTIPKKMKAASPSNRLTQSDCPRMPSSTPSCHSLTFFLPKMSSCIASKK